MFKTATGEDKLANALTKGAGLATRNGVKSIQLVADSTITKPVVEHIERNAKTIEKSSIPTINSIPEPKRLSFN